MWLSAGGNQTVVRLRTDPPPLPVHHTYKCVFRHRGGFVPNNGSISEKMARNPATHAGEADFLKRS